MDMIEKELKQVHQEEKMLQRATRKGHQIKLENKEGKKADEVEKITTRSKYLLRIEKYEECEECSFHAKDTIEGNGWKIDNYEEMKKVYNILCLLNGYNPGELKDSY